GTRPVEPRPLRSGLSGKQLATVRELMEERLAVRASIDQLLPDILSGAIEPGKVFDATTGLDGVPAGYQDMADRNSLKVLIKP
ncbi:hypothetical protein ACWEQH_20205, partial [Streptomyces sp. NPDC004166]